VYLFLTITHHRRSQRVADKHSARQAAQPDQRCPAEMNARTAIKVSKTSH
jgi:hypothetical protein